MLCLVHNPTSPGVPEALAWMTSLAPVGCLSPAVLTGDEQVHRCPCAVDRGECSWGLSATVDFLTSRGPACQECSYRLVNELLPQGRYVLFEVLGGQTTPT